MRPVIFRYFLWLTMITILILPLAACGKAPAEVNADLGQGFSLSIGQTAVIKGQNLQITLEDVIEDSRCPANVTCIWAGRASSTIKILQASSPYRMVLTQLGLTDRYTTATYQEYQISFYLRPYPTAGQTIRRDEYRLQLIVSK